MSSEGQTRHCVDRVREYREQVLYPKLFGAVSESYPLAADHFAFAAEPFECPSHWLLHNVLAFEPTANRRHWIFATSGLSNDWEEDSPEVRPWGLGCELLMQTAGEPAFAAEQLLYLLAVQLFRAKQSRRGSDALGDFDCIATCATPHANESRLRWLMLFPPADFPFEVELPSGRFDFYQVAAVSAAEAGYARSHGGAALLLRLEQAGAFPVIDWQRADVV